MNLSHNEGRDETIVTGDGVELAATIYGPVAGPEGVVVINSAMAVHRRFYRDFATWLATEGFVVVTYDYRGVGDSRRGELDDCDASIEDWVDGDMSAVIAWACEEWEGETLYLVGHSLGGQVMGLLGDRIPIDAAATVSAQSGYWRLQYPGEEWKVLLSASIVMPAITHLFGYLPWSRVFGGEDIPKRAALQWARGCRHRDYLLGEGILADTTGYDRFEAPIVAYSFEDDAWGYDKAVDAMMAHYEVAPVERVHVIPDEVGVESIGHFGFFRREMAFLWESFLDRLVAAARG